MRKLFITMLSVLIALVGFPATGIMAGDLSTQQKFDELKEEGIFTGFNDGSARLNEPMSREQFAAVLFRLWELKEEPSAPSYDDVLKTRWSFGEIEAVKRAGLMVGMGPRMFSPTAHVSVEQLAVILVRAYGMYGGGSTKVSGKVSSWARDAVSQALENQFFPAQRDYTIPATRGLLVETAYAVYSDMLGKASLSIKSVSPFDSNGVWILLNDAVESIDKDRFTIQDNSGGTLAITKATLSDDGKAILLTTGWQNSRSTYWLLIDGNFVFAFQGFETQPPKDATKPTITSFERLPNGVLEITFSEKVDPSSATNKSNYTINNNLGIRTVRLADNGRKVIITTGDQNPKTTYKLTVKGVKDTAGNVMNSRSDLSFGGSNDQKNPTVKSVEVNANATLTVRFSEKVTSNSAEDRANYRIDKRLIVTKAQLEPDGVSVTLFTSEQKDATVYTITISGVADPYGNVMTTGSWQFGGVVDRTPPEVTSIRTSGNDTVILTFSERLDSPSAENRSNYSIDGNLGTPSAADYDDSKLTVTLKTGKQVAGQIYYVTVNSLKDLGGQKIAANTRIPFSGAGTNPGSTQFFDSVQAVNDNTIELTFTGKLTKSDFSNMRPTIISDNGDSVSMTGWKWFIRQGDDGKKATVQFRTEKNTNPTLFKPGHVYVVQVTGIQGLNTENNANRKTFAGTEKENPAPYVTKAESLTNSSVKVVFSEPVKNVTGTAFQIRDTDGRVIDIASTQVESTGSIVTEVILNLSDKLRGGKVYQLFVVGGITDAAGWNGIKTKEGNDPISITFAGTNAENAAP